MKEERGRGGEVGLGTENKIRKMLAYYFCLYFSSKFSYAINAHRCIIQTTIYLAQEAETLFGSWKENEVAGFIVFSQ